MVCANGLWKKGDSSSADCALFSTDKLSGPNGYPLTPEFIPRLGNCCQNEFNEYFSDCNQKSSTIGSSLNCRPDLDNTDSGDGHGGTTQCCATGISCVDPFTSTAGGEGCKPANGCYTFPNEPGRKLFCQLIPSQEKAQWTDPDEGNSACTAAGCTGPNGDPDEPIPSARQFKWSIGGQVSGAACCGDDTNEFVRKFGVASLDAQVLTAYPAPQDTALRDACCPTDSSCVSPDGACKPAGLCYQFGNGNLAGFCDPGTSNSAEKGKWKDPDSSQAACEPSGGCSLPSLNSGRPFKFEIGGETIGGQTNKCCGDDPGEFSKTCEIDQAYSGKSCGLDPSACCDASTDCVDVSGNCAAQGSCSPFGATTGAKPSFCDNGIWKDPDTSAQFCQSAGCSFSYFPSSTDPSRKCCGDDHEASTAAGAVKEIVNAKKCSPGVCTSDTNDRACCDSTTDCVSQGRCFNADELFDIDRDGDKEICKAAVESTTAETAPQTNPSAVQNIGQWQDADESSANCGLVGTLQSPTTYMSSTPVCGLERCKEPGIAAVSGTSSFCCGDDPKEIFRQGISNICVEAKAQGSTETNDCIKDITIQTGNAQSVQHIYLNDGEFIGDDLCTKGIITSRTRFIATAMMGIANQSSPRNFTLFCDSASNTLNYLEYLIPNLNFRPLDQGSITRAEDFLAGIPPNIDTPTFSDKDCRASIQGVNIDLPCANNFCVLRYQPDRGILTAPKEEIIFGVSLNKQINTGIFPFIKTLEGVSDCDTAIGQKDGLFHQCNPTLTSSARAFYNFNMSSVLYSSNEIAGSSLSDATFSLTLTEKFFRFIRHPLLSIIDFAKTKLFSQQNLVGFNADFGFILDAQKFDKLYLERRGFKNIRGINEQYNQNSRQVISLAYTGLDQDICKTISPFDDRTQLVDPFIRFLCMFNPSNDTYYISSDSSLAAQKWVELTAGLRTKDTGCSPGTKPIVNLDAHGPFFIGQEIKFNAEVESCNVPLFYQWKVIGPDPNNVNSFETINSPTSPGQSLSQVKSFTHSKVFNRQGPVTVQFLIFDGQGNIAFTKSISFEITAATGCILRQNSCSSEENCIFSLSGEGDAHAAPCTGGYSNKVCCQKLFSEDQGTDGTCAEDTLVKLSPASDAHGDPLIQSSSFPAKLCIKSDPGTARCSMREVLPNSDGCAPDESCIAKVSDGYDAHFASCQDTGSGFGKSLCCSSGCSSVSLPSAEVVAPDKISVNTPAVFDANIDVCSSGTNSFSWEFFREGQAGIEPLSTESTKTTSQTFTQTGQYRAEFTLTDANGKTFSQTTLFFVSPSQDCIVRSGSCNLDGENPFFVLSDTEDAHAASFVTSNANYGSVVCCPKTLSRDTTGEISGTCQESLLVSLDQNQDAHGQRKLLSAPQTFDFPICASASPGTVSCVPRQANDPGVQQNGCLSNEICVIKLDDLNDGEFSTCVNAQRTNFQNSICCAVTP
ncbi:PKD domain-containing protein [Candidatus Woesearchaeota archaeon]|nr:PKD domain-containing protein [Candidatus Woesearchaeota archaeon]